VAIRSGGLKANIPIVLVIANALKRDIAPLCGWIQVAGEEHNCRFKPKSFGFEYHSFGDILKKINILNLRNLLSSLSGRGF